MPPFKIAAFYAFSPLPEPAALRAPLQRLCDENGVRGTLLLAPEGVNGTLAGRPESLDRVIAALREIAGIAALPLRVSHADTLPFLRMKVRLKQEIVKIGDASIDPNERTGTNVEPAAWNALLDDPDVTVIDVRNGFEVGLGSFVGAQDPETASFSDFPAYAKQHLDPKRDRKIAMFCTGGIRCEKASSFLLREGFSEVYQLEGGILAYLEQVPEAASRWRGSCFVFDGRVAVGPGLAVADDVTTCFGCRRPLTPADRASPAYEDGVSCPHCSAAMTPEHRASARERHRQVLRAERDGRAHLGTAAGKPADKPATRRAPSAAPTREHSAKRDAHGDSRSGST